MTVHVQDLVTDVVAEPEPRPAAGTGEQSTWDELEKVRAMNRRIERDRLRTHAAGHDD